MDESCLNEEDKKYINTTISDYLDDFDFATKEAEGKKKEAVQRMEPYDRLRWMMAIDVCGDIREAYMKVQDVLNRQQLDSRNSPFATPDFHDLIVEKFNDGAWIPQTTINSELHSDFGESIECPKREFYTLTKEKSKTLLLEYKHKLNEICKRYEMSGNGCGQLDDDENEIDDGQQFGRVNIELCRMKGGDDRHNFLLHEPVDLLYFWDIMDRHDLIHFTTAQLRGDNVATSDGTSALTAYGASSIVEFNDDGDSNGRSHKRQRKRKKDSVDDASKEMWDNVSKVSIAIEHMNENSVHVRIDSLRKEKLNLRNEWRKEKKKTDYDSDEDGEFYRSSIKEIEDSISTSKEYLDKVRKA